MKIAIMHAAVTGRTRVLEAATLEEVIGGSAAKRYVQESWFGRGTIAPATYQLIGRRETTPGHASRE
jgi:hypothetical protein